MPGDGKDRDIAEKLGIKAGMTVAILNAPNYFDYDLGDLPEGVTVHRDSFEQPADVFLVFAARADEAERGFQRALTVLPSDGAVWVVWERDPADGAGELDEGVLRDLLAKTGLVGDKATVIDDTWQGLRFVVPEGSPGQDGTEPVRE